MTDKIAATERQTAPGTHVPVLDGIRGLAILLVMQSHFYGLSYGLAGRQPTLAIDRFVAKLSRTGWTGVDLFFVLSGFLITGILFDAKEGTSYFRNFYARRLLRIFPLYYAFLLFVLLVLPHLHPFDAVADLDNLKRNQFWYWAYLVNIYWSVEPLHGEASLIHLHFWSLAVEEQFYLVWPALVLLLSRRKLMITCGILVVTAFIVRVVLTSSISDGFSTPAAPGIFPPARMDSLALGAFLALAARSPGGLAPYARWAPAVLGASGLVVASLFIAGDGLSTLDPQVQTVGYSALAFFFAALLTLTVTASPGSALAWVFANPVMRFFGRYAYALYVFHVLIAFELANRVIAHGWLPSVGGSQLPGSLAFAAGAIAISVAAAWLSWQLYEKQFLKLKALFPYERRQRPLRSTPPPMLATTEQPSPSPP